MSSNEDYSAVQVEAMPARGSWLPLAFAAVAGLLVIGLFASILLTGQQPAGASGAAGSVAVGTGKEMMAVGYLAPDFTLATANGGQVQLSSYRGQKPVWVNFWATWCPHCSVEMPQMEQLYQQNKDKGLEILGVDDAESPSLVKPYITNHGYSWNFALDPTGQVSAQQYRITGLPTHIFVGRDGVIKSIVIGSIEQPRMVSELSKIMTP